jgi:hypothetical protein
MATRARSGIAARQDVARLERPPGVDLDGPEGRQPGAAPTAARLAATGPLELPLQLLVALSLGGRHDLHDLARVDPEHGEVVVGELLLLGRTRFLRLADHGLDVGGEHRDAFVIQPLLVGSDQRGDPLLQAGAPVFGFVARLAASEDLLRRRQCQLPQHERIEQRLHGVEVALGDRIVHVVVALGAADRQSHEGGGNRLDGRERQLTTVLVVADHVAACQEPQRKLVVEPGFDAATDTDRGHLGADGGAVTRQLRADELVVGEVVVEGTDHPVAPEMDPGRGGHSLVDVGVAQDVEPVPPVADAMLFAGEELVDHLLVGARGRIAEERLLFGGGGGQAGEVEVDPAQECPGIGRSGRCQALSLVPGGDEGIDRVRRRCHSRRDFGADEWLEDPQRRRFAVRRCLHEADLNEKDRRACQPAGERGHRERLRVARKRLARPGNRRRTARSSHPIIGQDVAVFKPAA